MSTVEEIKRAIGRLPAQEQSKLREWIYATEPEPEPAALDRALDAGMQAADEGRVRSVEDVRSMIHKWAGK